MTEMSPEISFAEYHTYQVSDTGAFVGPVTNANFVCLAKSHNRYVYAFADNAGAFPGSVWGHVQTYKLSQLTTPANDQWRTTPPWIAHALNKNTAPSEDDGWGTALTSIQLPRSIDGQTEGIRYFFVMTRWPLLPRTIAEIARLGPGGLLPASMPVGELSIDGRHQKLISTEGGTVAFVARDTPPTADNYPNMFAPTRRYVFVVDIYTIAEHLAGTLDANMTKMVRFVDPASAGAPAERAETELRLARYAVAREVDMLRRAGANIGSHLATSSANGALILDELLHEFDLDNRDSGLGRLVWLRDKSSRALLRWLQSPLWDLLCQDARDTPERANLYYDRHLLSTLHCLDSLAHTPEGGAYLKLLYEICLPSGSRRVPPATSIEFVAQNIIFTERRKAGAWEEHIVSKVARNLYSLYTKLATPMAQYALERLERIDYLTPDSELTAWASRPMQTNMGLTAYRWAYHLRNNFDFEEIRVGDTIRVLVFKSGGEPKSIPVFEIEIGWNRTEWMARLGDKAPTGEALGLGFGLVGVVFSTAALVEAVRKERNRDTALLKTASAYMSLGQSTYFRELFGRLITIGATSRGVAAIKWAGFVGAALGAIAAHAEAVDLQVDHGETAAAVITYGSGVGAAVLAGWASLSSLKIVAVAPGGWWILGGAALTIGAIFIVAAIKDSELQDLVEHSIVGTASGVNHVAPGMSLCRSGRFGEWAGGWHDLQVLEAQRAAFHGVATAFRVQGTCFVRDYPQVRFAPQSLRPESIFEVSVAMVWTTPQGLVVRQFRGDAQLHVGHDRLLRVVSSGGEALEISTLDGVAVIGSVVLNGARCIDWLVAPSEALRAETANFLLHSVTLQTRLWITGLQATAVAHPNNHFVVVPTPRHGDQFQLLTYELVQPPAPAPSSLNPHAVPAAIPVALPGDLNSQEVWSTSAYSRA